MNRDPLPLYDKDLSLLNCGKRQIIVLHSETFKGNVDIPVLKLYEYNDKQLIYNQLFNQ